MPHHGEHDEPDDAQAGVAAVLRSRPASGVPAAFAGRLSARLTAEGGWLGLADWRVWTFRLAPVAAALVIVAVLAGSRAVESAFSLTSVVETWAAGDRVSDPPAASLFWQADVPAESLLVTILTSGPDEALETGSTAGQEGVK
jgi:hypothetical protein